MRVVSIEFRDLTDQERDVVVWKIKMYNETFNE